MTTRILTLLLPFLLAVTAALLPAYASAREFEVASFRDLPNDVSAFINPVRDLNDEDCALLKIVAPADFVFSTPLGIVRRVDNVGEIWLYLPHGSRKITLKHAEWGILRDYQFPSKLESHKTYEMTLSYPQVLPPPVPYSEPTAVSIRDTLVVTRVDTLIMKPVRPKIPLSTDLLIGAGFGGKAPYGFASLMGVVMKRHGGFIRISSDGCASGHVSAACDRNGLIDGSQRFYSGKTRRSLFMLDGGAIHRLSSKVAVYEGLGYGTANLDWQLAPSEGGGYVRNSYFSTKGLTGEVGGLMRIGRLDASVSVITIKGKEWFGTMGIGIRFGKNP